MKFEQLTSPLKELLPRECLCPCIADDDRKDKEELLDTSIHAQLKLAKFCNGKARSS